MLWLLAWVGLQHFLCAHEARGSSFIRKAAGDHGASHNGSCCEVSRTSSEHSRPRHAGSPSPRAQRQGGRSPSSRSLSLLPGPFITCSFYCAHRSSAARLLTASASAFWSGVSGCSVAVLRRAFSARPLRSQDSSSQAAVWTRKLCRTVWKN